MFWFEERVDFKNSAQCGRGIVVTLFPLYCTVEGPIGLGLWMLSPQISSFPHSPSGIPLSSAPVPSWGQFWPSPLQTHRKRMFRSVLPTPLGSHTVENLRLWSDGNSVSSSGHYQVCRVGSWSLTHELRVLWFWFSLPMSTSCLASFPNRPE